jgi:hypothetical protein
VNITNTWSDGTNAASGTNASYTVGTISATRTLLTASCVATAGTSAFSGVAMGDPKANPVALSTDAWSINQDRKLSNDVVGL